jgi:hypothetical protein
MKRPFRENGLDVLSVYLVELSMGANKPDVDHSVGVVDPGYEPVFVTGNVEDHPTVLEDAGRAEIGFDFSRGLPIGVLDLLVPGQERLFGIRMAFPECLEGGEGDQPHEEP